MFGQDQCSLGGKNMTVDMWVWKGAYWATGHLRLLASPLALPGNWWAQLSPDVLGILVTARHVDTKFHRCTSPYINWQTVCIKPTQSFLIFETISTLLIITNITNAMWVVVILYDLGKNHKKTPTHAGPQWHFSKGAWDGGSTPVARQLNAWICITRASITISFTECENGQENLPETLKIITWK